MSEVWWPYNWIRLKNPVLVTERQSDVIEISMNYLDIVLYKNERFPSNLLMQIKTFSLFQSKFSLWLAKDSVRLCSPSVAESFASHNKNLDWSKEKVLTCIRRLEGNLSFLWMPYLFYQFCFTISFVDVRTVIVEVSITFLQM